MTDELRLLGVQTCPRDLPGERKFVRWLAMSFHQDSELVYGSADFEVVLRGALDMYPAEDLGPLRDDVAELLRDVEASDAPEAEHVRRFWFALGGEFWPPNVVLAIGLRRIVEAIDKRLAGG
jgi:hypothetical protein